MTLKIVFMGTPDFAVPVLDSLIGDGYDIALVVTQPDRPRGRGKRLAVPPVKARALEKGLRIEQPEKIRGGAFLTMLTDIAPDIIIVVAYGRILPEAVLKIPPLGCVNVHASLLPAYRGAAPINWAVIRGEPKSGVTTMLMDEGMDTGKTLLKSETPIGDDETAGELFDRLSTMGANLLIETLNGLKSGTIEPEAQDESLATYAPMLKKSDGRIEWDKEADKVAACVRGVTPWPGAFTTYKDKKVKIHCGSLATEGGVLDSALPGTVVSLEDGFIKVACSPGFYDIIELQMENKKRMSSADFLRGVHIQLGDRFS